jgi:hypothetical protein
VRRQAKRDAALPLTQKRRRASLAAAPHNFISLHSIRIEN